MALRHVANTQLNNNFNNKAQVVEAALAHFHSPNPHIPRFYKLQFNNNLLII